MTAGSFRLRGHENQSDGLISALSDRAPVSIHTVPTPRARRANTLWRALLGAGTRSPPNPDLLIGTGNAIQLPVLVSRRRRGGYAVVLMKTSFPVASFDLMIVPTHDLLVTRGAFNRARPAEEKSPGEGLILIGGPEREHPWAPDMLETQITAIADCHPDIHWCAASSRRTPTEFLPHLRKLKLANLDTVAVDDVHADWLPRKVAATAAVRITEDSVNMLYEALGIGVPVIGCDHGGVGEALAGGFPERRVTAGDEDALLSKVRAFRSHPTRPATPVPFTLEAILAKTLALYAELAGGSPPYH